MIDDLSERDPVEELAEEFLERRRRREPATPEEYARRFPALADRIRSVFPALLMLDEIAPEAVEQRSQENPKQLGEFRIIRQIGRGGMGIVYEAVQESLDRRVALKVLPGESARDAVYLDRFRSEARTAARLHHTNIVAIHGAGQADGVHFLVMQLINGVGLDAVLGGLRRARPIEAANAVFNDRTLASGLSTTADANEHLDLVRLFDHDRAKYFRTVARLIAEAADALAHAHQFGVVHRDVKPSNLLLARDGSLFVSDFGLAKAEGAADLTRTGLVVGTPRYVAPERFNGIEGPGSDVFALGATLYELLTLRPAFDAPTRERLIEQMRNVEPVSPRSIAADVPRDLETLALSALAKEPQRRPSAAALAEDLHRWLSGRPIRARRIGPLERLAIWARRNPLVATLTAGLFLALTTGLGVALGLWRTSEGHRVQAVENAEIADRRREQSEETLNKALDAMDEYFRKVCEDKLLEAPGMLGLRRELLASAVPYYEAFLATHDANPRLKVESLRAKASLARVKVSMGTKQDAAAALDGALAACRGLLDEMPDNPKVRRELARTLEAMARVKTSQSQTGAADNLYREAAAAYAWFGDPASQLNSIRALLATADAAYNLNRMAQVQADMKEIRRRLDELAHSISDVPAFQQVNARAHIYQASYLQKDNPADAHRSAEQACAIMEELTAKFPNQPFYRFEIAAALAERGIAERQLKRPAEAKLSLTAGRTILQRLHAENPLENDYATRLVANYRAASNVEQDLGQFNAALTLLLAARQLLEPLLAADAADTRLLRIMAEVTSHMGFLFDKLNRDEESYEAHGAAGDAFAKLHEREPEFIGLLTNLGVCRRNQALTCMRTNRAEEGAQLAREAVACYLKALATSPNTPIAKTAETRLYPAYRTLIDCHQQMGRWDLIEADFVEVLTVRPTTVAMRVNVAKIYAEFAEKALGQVGPPSPEQSERFERFAGLAVQTLRAAAQEDVEAARKAFKIEVFRPILHVEAFQQAVAEFQLRSKAANK